MRGIAPLLTVFALCLAVAAPGARAAAGDAREGIDYVQIKPPQPQSGTGIEVVEFFSYGCPHCNDFEPFVSKWRAALPKDVNFRRVPISFGRPQWAALSRLYLAIAATGDLAKLDRQIFEAIHTQKLPLANDQAILAWASGKVADTKKFTDMYRSFGIQASVAQADQAGSAYGISGVPSLAVGGRYLVVAKEARGYQDLLSAVDRVIELARKNPAR